MYQNTHSENPLIIHRKINNCCDVLTHCVLLITCDYSTTKKTVTPRRIEIGKKGYSKSYFSHANTVEPGTYQLTYTYNPLKLPPQTIAGGRYRFEYSGLRPYLYH